MIQFAAKCILKWDFEKFLNHDYCVTYTHVLQNYFSNAKILTHPVEIPRGRQENLALQGMHVARNKAYNPQKECLQ